MNKIAAIIVTLCMMAAPGISFSQSTVQATEQGVNLSSPEVTWNEFKKAIVEGNYDMALECCCPGETKKINRYKKLGSVKTSRIFRAIKSIEKVYQDEETAKYMLHRDIKGKNFTTYISFAKIDNQWKINKY
jgi:hypothetical protein